MIFAVLSIGDFFVYLLVNKLFQTIAESFKEKNIKQKVFISHYFRYFPLQNAY